IPGTIIGAILLEELRNKKSEAWVLFTVGMIIVISAVLSLLQFKDSNKAAKSRPYLLPFLSFLIVSETGFSSAGAGAIGIVMLFTIVLGILLLRKGIAGII